MPDRAGQEEPFPGPDNQSKMKRSCENAEHVGKHSELDGMSPTTAWLFWLTSVRKDYSHRMPVSTSAKNRDDAGLSTIVERGWLRLRSMSTRPIPVECKTCQVNWDTISQKVWLSDLSRAARTGRRWRRWAYRYDPGVSDIYRELLEAS